MMVSPVFSKERKNVFDKGSSVLCCIRSTFSVEGVGCYELGVRFGRPRCKQGACWSAVVIIDVAAGLLVHRSVVAVGRVGSQVHRKECQRAYFWRIFGCCELCLLIPP